MAKPADSECPGEMSVESRGECPAADHLSDSPVAEAGGGDAAMAGDCPEGRDRPPGLPAPSMLARPAPGTLPGWCRRAGQRLGLAFLVGLEALEHEAQAVVVFADVVDVQADELAAP